MRAFRPDKRYLQYNGHKIEIFNEGVTVKINANTIGKAFKSNPKTFLKQPEVLKYMHDYGKYRLRPGDSQDLKDRRHYSCSRGYSHDGIYNETYYFYKNLAVRYASWLNLDFGVWLFDQLDEIILELGNHRGFHRWEKKSYY